MSEQGLTPVTCDQCGADMNLRDSGSRKSPPVVGKRLEWRRYACPECGIQTRYQREPGADWEKAGG